MTGAGPRARASRVREAGIPDIDAMHVIRRSVVENALRDPARVIPADYRSLLEDGGRGWVYEEDGNLLGFGIADARHRNIWALFVAPGAEGRGIGRLLLEAMVHWLFDVGDTPICLTTAPQTRAARFYARAGWREVWRHGDREQLFSLDRCAPQQ